MGAKKKQININVINGIIDGLQSKHKSLSERGVAGLLGVSPGYIWQCKNRKQTPNEEVVKRAAKLLGKNPHSLLAENNMICSEVLSVYLEDPVKYSRIILEDKKND